MPRPQTGEVVNERYTVEEILGQRGSTVVCRAHHIHLGHIVELRVHPLGDDAESLARFQRSARLMAQIRDPHVASLIDYLVWRGDCYIVTEWGRGKTFAEALRTRGALAWPRALALLKGVLSGLHAVHAASVVHRDVTPDNIIIEAGDSPRVKLINLDLVKSLTPEQAITSHGIVIGTPTYMSPEQLDQRPVDGRSDLFQVGLILHEMITGRPVRATDDPVRLAATILQPPPPVVAPPHHPPVPPELDRLIRWALASAPAARVPNAREFAARIDAIQRAGPTRPEVSLRQDSMFVEVNTPEYRQPSRRIRLRASSQVAASISAQRNAAEPAELLRPAQRNRIRAILAAAFPPATLTRELLGWLATQATSMNAFTVGQNFWVAVLWSTNDEDVRRIGRHITARLHEHFADSVRVRARIVGEAFQLPRACLDGSVPPPYEVLELLEEIATV